MKEVQYPETPGAISHQKGQREKHGAKNRGQIKGWQIAKSGD